MPTFLGAILGRRYFEASAVEWETIAFFHPEIRQGEPWFQVEDVIVIEPGKARACIEARFRSPLPIDPSLPSQVLPLTAYGTSIRGPEVSGGGPLPASLVYKAGRLVRIVSPEMKIIDIDEEGNVAFKTFEEAGAKWLKGKDIGSEIAGPSPTSAHG